MSEKKEWWFPVLCDEEHFARLREDYPENAHITDEELHDHYDHGKKYSTAWDHVGDAYVEYEELADAYLALLAEKS